MSIELRVPDLGETVETATLAVWLKQEGDAVEAGEPIVELETEKTSVEVEAPVSGVLETILVEAGPDGLEPGTLLATISEGAARANTPPSTVSQPQQVPVEVVTPTDPSGQSNARDASARYPRSPEESPARRSSVPAASPLARRMAAAAALDLVTIQGTGRGGQIGKADVERAIADRRDSESALEAASGTPVAPTINTPKEPVASTSFDERPLSAMQRVTAQRMTESKQTVPHFYLSAECDMRRVVEQRAAHNAEGRHVTLTAVIVKAVAEALRQVPAANSSWHEGQVRQYKSIHVAVAVNTEAGLVAPVVRDADRKRLDEVASELRALGERARSGTLAPDDYAGGTFTVSNLGMFDVSSLYAIVNPPQSCILGVGAVVQKPVVRAATVEVGILATLSLSADHRALDGATGAEFLQALRRVLETPASLFTAASAS